MFIFSRERRVTIIMGTITLAFLICIWPYGVIFMMGVLQQKKEILQKVATLMYLNSLINPVLYIFINKQVRRALVKLFTCQKQDERYKCLMLTSALLILCFSQEEYESLALKSINTWSHFRLPL